MGLEAASSTSWLYTKVMIHRAHHLCSEPEDPKRGMCNKIERSNKQFLVPCLLLLREALVASLKRAEHRRLCRSSTYCKNPHGSFPSLRAKLRAMQKQPYLFF
mmetsp:Transcript_12589/g.22235  ORF Transcript_12589/g.22235 Transcript_12589/m.22235 type:complete len:103 (-) Transcript_12589:112-420(-)